MQKCLVANRSMLKNTFSKKNQRRCLPSFYLKCDTFLDIFLLYSGSIKKVKNCEGQLPYIKSYKSIFSVVNFIRNLF